MAIAAQGHNLYDMVSRGACVGKPAYVFPRRVLGSAAAAWSHLAAAWISALDRPTASGMAAIQGMEQMITDAKAVLDISDDVDLVRWRPLRGT